MILLQRELNLQDPGTSGIPGIVHVYTYGASLLVKSCNTKQVHLPEVPLVRALRSREHTY